MPYKNSAGNTGISNQYGQWRYFTASLGRLEDYRAPRLNVQAQPVVAKEQADWGKAVLGVTQGLLGLFEMRRNASYKAADDWLAKHSLEEYHDLMKKGNVPFQDDPLAMQRLKFRHGEILADIAQRDFQSRIDKGEFVGMEPEEIDAENFKYMNQVLTEDTDVYPYKADGDYFFNQGFWANSNKFRSEVFNKSKTVGDNYTKQHAMITTQADLTKMVEGGADATQLVNAMGLSFDAFGWHFTPSDWQKIATNMADQLSNTPWGDKVLEDLKGMKVPTMGNTTFADILGGEEGLQNLKLSSVNFRYNNNIKLRSSDRSTIESLVDVGNVEELQRRAVEIRGQDGGDSDRFKLWWDAVPKAQTQRDKLIKQRAKQYKDDIVETAKDDMAKMYLDRFGGRDDDFKSDRDAQFWEKKGRELYPEIDDDTSLKLTQDRIYSVFESRVRDKTYSPAKIASMATNPYVTYNPAREYINKNCSSLFSKINGQIQNAMTNPKTDLTPPENLAHIMEIYRADPSAFGNLNKKETMTMQTLCFGMNAGLFDYKQAVTSMAWEFNNEQAISGKGKGSADYEAVKRAVIKRDLLNKLSVTTLGTGGAVDKTPQIKELVETMAGNFILMGLKPEEAITSSLGQLNDNFYLVGNNFVPKNFFGNDKLTVQGTEIAVGKWVKDVEKQLSDMHMSFDDVNVWHNPYSDSIEVIDLGGRDVLFSLDKKGFSEIVDREADNITLKVKAEDYRRASGGTGVVPETFEGGD